MRLAIAPGESGSRSGEGVRGGGVLLLGMMIWGKIPFGPPGERDLLRDLDLLERLGVLDLFLVLFFLSLDLLLDLLLSLDRLLDRLLSLDRLIDRLLSLDLLRLLLLSLDLLRLLLLSLDLLLLLLLSLDLDLLRVLERLLLREEADEEDCLFLSCLPLPNFLLSFSSSSESDRESFEPLSALRRFFFN